MKILWVSTGVWKEQPKETVFMVIKDACIIITGNVLIKCC